MRELSDLQQEKKMKTGKQPLQLGESPLKNPSLSCDTINKIRTTRPHSYLSFLSNQIHHAPLKFQLPTQLGPPCPLKLQLSNQSGLPCSPYLPAFWPMRPPCPPIRPPYPLKPQFSAQSVPPLPPLHSSFIY